MKIKILKFDPHIYSFPDMYFENPINFDLRYGFIIGKRNKPTAEDRDRIVQQFDQAWKGIFGDFPDHKVEPPGYSVAVVQDIMDYEPSDDPLYFESGGFYLVFVLKTSDPNFPDLEEEEQITNREITRMISDLYGDRLFIRAGVITIVDGSIDIIPAISYDSGTVLIPG